MYTNVDEDLKKLTKTKMLDNLHHAVVKSVYHFKCSGQGMKLREILCQTHAYILFSCLFVFQVTNILHKWWELKLQQIPESLLQSNLNKLLLSWSINHSWNFIRALSGIHMLLPCLIVKKEIYAYAVGWY